MEHGAVHNLATVKKWVALKRDRYTRNCNTDAQLYGYDIARYGGEFNDALKVSGLFEVLETYALAYFVYVIESSLIVSNYSVREDNEISSSGNFPMWRTDFFPEGITEGRHAHILDFDALRLGKKVIENNPHSGSFEFGVVAITEVGKERGNNLELKEVKKGTRETNQKNDLFNSWLKMCRHSATIDNFPFIKVFTDEQRPESWGADARDLCEILHIVSAGEQRLALPFYTIEDALSRWLFERFVSLYYDFRFRRGDNSLLVHILKSLVAVLWRRNLRIPTVRRPTAVNPSRNLSKSGKSSLPKPSRNRLNPSAKKRKKPERQARSPTFRTIVFSRKGACISLPKPRLSPLRSTMNRNPKSRTSQPSE